MNVIYTIYKWTSALTAMVLFPVFFGYTLATGRFRHHLAERLGVIPREITRRLSGSPRIWIHAVSLGEVKVAKAVVDALVSILPECVLIISTSTEHGRALALEIMGRRCHVVYSPIDVAYFVRKALSIVRPQVMVFMETEIWPAWIFESRRMGIRTALLNGRISARSFGKYLRLSPLFRHVLKSIDAFSMISEVDSARIVAMGAEPRKIEISGNAKYDFLALDPDPKIEEQTRSILTVRESQQVFVAGSTRKGEEKILLGAYEEILKEFPDVLLIIVPRHIDRKGEICALVKNRGFGYHLWTDIDIEGAKRIEKIVIVDTFGELFNLYSVATIAFCGGSLVPLGGQNPLEPAAWGKVVFYGPSMENFMDSKELLESSGAGIEITDARMLAQKALWFLKRPKELAAIGKKGRAAIKGNLGAAKRHAEVIKGLLVKPD